MENSKQSAGSGSGGRSVGLWISHIVIGVVAFAIGGTIGQRGSVESPTVAVEDSGTDRVTGIGGLFFKSEDPAALLIWYRTHLGIDSYEWGGFAFQWQEKEHPSETGYTIWTPFPDDTDYFSPGEQSFMINFRVADLTGLVASLREEGVEIVGGIERHPNGSFAWILDPEGRKIELWEPVPSSEDPYL